MISLTSHIPQWIADLENRRMLDVNPAALQFWRMTRQQFLAASFSQFFHPDEMPRWENYIQQGTWGETGPWKCTRGDGTVFYCTVRWHMMDHQGVYSALIFPVRAGDSPTTMVQLENRAPGRAEQVGASSD